MMVYMIGPCDCQNGWFLV